MEARNSQQKLANLAAALYAYAAAIMTQMALETASSVARGACGTAAAITVAQGVRVIATLARAK